MHYLHHETYGKNQPAFEVIPVSGPIHLLRLLTVITALLFGFGAVHAQQGGPNRPGHGTSSDGFNVRTEETMGDWAYLGDDAAITASHRWTPLTSTVRRMATNFLVENDRTTVSITFSAEAWVENKDRSLYVRLLLDGKPMNPGDVLFADSKTPNARAFTFTQVVEKAGLHTVEVEWAASREARARIKDASLLVRHSDRGNLTVVTPASGPSVSTSNPAWSSVPDMGAWVYVDNNETLTASMSAESYVTSGGRMYLRAMVGGVPMTPGDVIFAEGKRPQSRKMTFGMEDLAPGWYWVEFQWLVNAAAATAYIGDRTLEITSLPKDNLNGLRSHFVAAPSGVTVSQDSSTYQPVPDMTLFTSIPQNAAIAVQFNAEMWTKNDANLQVRLAIGGVPVPGSEVELTADAGVDVHSYVLDAKNLNIPGGGLITTVQLEWRKEGGDSVHMGDRAMNVLIKPGDEPDLSEPASFGMSKLTVEPHIGERDVVTILIDANLPGTPAPIAAWEMEDFLYDDPQTIPDYYYETSNGRLHLNNVATLGWLGLDNDSDHYWNANYDCDAGDFFTGGHQERWAEAIDKASMGFNFSDYDHNKDGLLDPRTELGIVLIVNQAGSGDGVTRPLTPYCSGIPYTADGVIVPEITETYITGFGTQWLIVAHELAHHLFALSDMYVSDHAYDPGRLSLMSDMPGGSTPHLDAVNKLWLGWVQPTVVRSGGNYTLADIRDGGKVLILPRKDRDGREYYVLESRQNQNAGTGFDVNISTNGIAVWHAVEDPVENSAAPNCVNQPFWNGVSADNARRGIRLVRPTLQFSNINATWDSVDYDLFDNGLVCPNMGAANNILNWADGMPSDYWITNWSLPGPVMDFDISVF